MTNKGITEAQLTAEWMKDEVLSRGIDKIKIISSPMIRAIQTASIIADCISADEIEVNNGYVEHLDPGCAKMNELEIRQKSTEEIQNEYFKDRNFVKLNDLNNDVEDIHSRIPENHPRAEKRIKEYVARLLESEDFKSNELIIIVTHAYCQDAFIEMFEGRRIITDSCAISAVEIDIESNRSRIIHNRYCAWMDMKQQ